MALLQILFQTTFNRARQHSRKRNAFACSVYPIIISLPHGSYKYFAIST